MVKSPDNEAGWQAGSLGVSRGVAECVAREARTRGFESLTLAGFAFIRNSLPQSIGGCQFWDVLKFEAVEA
jgi:hypothetical protein